MRWWWCFRFSSRTCESPVGICMWKNKVWDCAAFCCCCCWYMRERKGFLEHFAYLYMYIQRDVSRDSSKSVCVSVDRCAQVRKPFSARRRDSYFTLDNHHKNAYIPFNALYWERARNAEQQTPNTPKKNRGCYICECRKEHSQRFQRNCCSRDTEQNTHNERVLLSFDITIQNGTVTWWHCWYCLALS